MALSEHCCSKEETLLIRLAYFERAWCMEILANRQMPWTMRTRPRQHRTANPMAYQCLTMWWCWSWRWRTDIKKAHTVLSSRMKIWAEN